MFYKQVEGALKFTKSLSASEVKYKYIGFPKSVIEEFSDKDVIFKMKFKGKTYDMKVNNKGCIMLTRLYEKCRFEESDEITITDDKKKCVYAVNIALI